MNTSLGTKVISNPQTNGSVRYPAKRLLDFRQVFGGDKPFDIVDVKEPNALLPHSIMLFEFLEHDADALANLVDTVKYEPTAEERDIEIWQSEWTRTYSDLAFRG